MVQGSTASQARPHPGSSDLWQAFGQKRKWNFVTFGPVANIADHYNGIFFFFFAENKSP